MRVKLNLFAVLFLIVLFNICFVSAAGITGDTITGESITGNATSHQVVMSIAVVAASNPSLTLLGPNNETYFYNESLLLNYETVGEEVVLYNLDGNSNITITGQPSIFFSASEGQHTLYLYSTNSRGTNFTSVIFDIDLETYTVDYEEYNGAYKGDSTKFNQYSFEEIQELEEIILENTQYGKMNFSQEINVTQDSNFSDFLTNLSANTEISFNLIEINGENLPNFDKSATLHLYNLSFSNPRILKDGSVCSATDCSVIDYSGGDLEFTVTGFSTYSAEETPSGEETTPGGGGGGGSSQTTSFEIDKDYIKTTITQGITYYEEIEIKNTHQSTLDFTISTPDMNNLIKIDTTSFSLKLNERKTIKLNILAGPEIIPDLYLGKLRIVGGSMTKEIPVAISVDSLGALFDIKATIPRQFRTVSPGEDFIAEVSLYSLGKLGRVDTEIEYRLVEEETGEVIITETETIAIETQAGFIKTFEIPKDIQLGHYIFYVKATYEGKVASSTAEFQIKDSSTLNLVFGRYFGLTISIILLGFLILWYEIRKVKKDKKPTLIIKKHPLGSKKRRDPSISKFKKAFNK